MIMCPSIKIAACFVCLLNIFVVAPGSDEDEPGSVPVPPLIRRLFHHNSESDSESNEPGSAISTLACVDDVPDTPLDPYTKCLRDVSLVFRSDDPQRNFLFALKALNLDYFTSQTNNTEAASFYKEIYDRLDWRGRDENIWTTAMFCKDKNKESTYYWTNEYFCIADLHDLQYTQRLRGIEAFHKIYHEEIFSEISTKHNLTPLVDKVHERKFKIFQSYFYYHFEVAFNLDDESFLSKSQFCSRYK